MCRLLGKIGNLEVTDEVKMVEEFRKLAHSGCVPKGDPKGHRDGWGFVFYKNDKVSFRYKNPTDALKDLNFRELKKEMAKNRPDLFLGHLRKASVGSRTVNNTQPYLLLNFSFAHNGTIFNSDKVKLKSGNKNSQKGDTDSEKLFLLIMQNIKNENRDAVVEATKRAIRNIRKDLDYTAMNIILSDGKKMWALREINEKNEEVRKLKMEKYYELYIGRNKKTGGVVFSSEKISKALNWKLMRNHEMIEVEFINGKINTRSVKI